MKIAVVKSITNFTEIAEDDGSSRVDISVNSTPIQKNIETLDAAYSIYSSAKASLDREFSESAKHSSRIIIAIEYEEGDGLVLFRSLTPSSFEEFEKIIVDDLKFSHTIGVLQNISNSVVSLGMLQKENQDIISRMNESLGLLEKSVAKLAAPAKLVRG